MKKYHDYLNLTRLKSGGMDLVRVERKRSTPTFIEIIVAIIAAIGWAGLFWYCIITPN